MPGDGRTLVRELVQNADDAEARWLKFVVLEEGWSGARNSLLHGPALVVANDGPFPDEHRRALRKAIGGSKKGEVDKIGAFGIGLKSVFTSVRLSCSSAPPKPEWRLGILNPWHEVDSLFPDWRTLDTNDEELLQMVTEDLIGESTNGLLLWIPLRQGRHDRGDERTRHWLSNHLPTTQSVCSWFECSTSAALLLGQCGHLRAINAWRARSPEDLGERVRLMGVSRPDERWLGRYTDEESVERQFGGEIKSDDAKWSVFGIESLDRVRLRDLTADPGWPMQKVQRNGRHAAVKRKALPHAAVSVLLPIEPYSDRLGMRMRWAAFLPLDDDPSPTSSSIVDTDGPSPAWEIILHGYFWPSQDRRSIPGVTDEGGDTPIDGDMRARWNRRLCEEQLLPLLPRALADAVEGVDEGTARELLNRVEGSDILRSRMPHITRRHWLLPVVAHHRVHWSAIDAQDAEDAERLQVLSIPKWDEAPEGVRAHFLASCREGAGDAVFIEETAPRLSGELDDWTIDHLECLLNSIPADTFASTASLRWITGVVRHVLGRDVRSDNPRTAAFVRWLALRISEDALAATVRSVSRDTRNELREAWRDLCEAVPREWLVETPVGTLRAVEDLTSRDRIIGKGLFLLPVRPRSSESRPTLHSDSERLDRALTALGERLQVGGESGRMRHSRLVLAETLLSIRPECPMDDALRRLPFVRTIRLPEDREEAWSVADFRYRIDNRRVFATPPSEAREDNGISGTRPKRTSDPKSAVAELATALAQPVWLVNGDAVASIAADVPTPEPATLADAVLRANEFAEPGSRFPLLRRLVAHMSGNANVRLAARALLAGRAVDVVGHHTELFQVRGGHGRALLILLRLLDRSWCAVDRRLAGSLSQDTLEALSVGQADLEAMHRLLDECLGSQVDWTALRDEEVLHLLSHLYSPEPEAQQRWRRMPLHRDIDGARGAFDDRAVRSGTTSEFVLPAELRAGVRVLDPEPEVSGLYQAVSALGRDRVLQLMLEYSQPWRFAPEIVQQVRADDGPVRLPRDRDLRRLLKASCWLPDRDGEGLAPEAVLIAPEEVLNAVHVLAEYGAFGDKRLPYAVDPQIWQTAEPVVREILGRRARARQIERMVDALDSDRVAQVDGGAWLVMPEAGLVDRLLISYALETPLVGSHPGWKLLHTVDHILRLGDSPSRDNPRPLLKLARSLCAPVPWERQLEMLTLLTASRPARDTPGRRMFSRLLDCFVETGGFFEHVLPEVDLPTQDGNWHTSRDVARTEIGVARQHRLASELRPVLRLDDDRPPQPMPGGYDNFSESAADALRPYFEPWRYQVRHGAVGAFLSLLGSGSRGEIAKLAEEWLGEDLSIEGMRSDSKLVGANGKDPCAGVVVWVTPRVSRGDRVHALNVIGEWAEMEAERDANTLFATNPERYPGSSWGIAPRVPFWEIGLRDVDPQHRTSSELLQLLGGTVEKWATKYLNLDRERVKNWWAEWGGTSQADLRPVLASITAHLPLTLRQLNVGDSEPLQDALRAAERAQRKREQAPSNQAIRIERESLDRLANLIKRSEHQEFLWKRVNELMHRYGYRPDSVLLELAQNADDALAQAAEINKTPLPPSSRKLLVRVWEDGGRLTVDVIHRGRTINDTGGTAFQDDQDRQWDQDLYFMMLMSLSGKPGEVPGQGSSSATTGRFGLGFKSVHLVSPSTSVVSGSIAFSIAGGLLPEKLDGPEDADPWMIEDRRATRVRMPLRQDMDGNQLIQSLFDRFSYARVLLPVFARQVRQVVVEGGPYPGVHVFDGKQIEGTSTWKVGAKAELPNHDGRWQVLRFRPSGSGREDMGTAALALGLRDGIPTAFQPDVPFLWNVTPTSEKWACGYVVNGPFKLDPGRTHVSLDDPTTLQTVDGLGYELGRGLIELHDALTGNRGGALRNMFGGDIHGFLSCLWEVLASGVDRDDTLRSKFVLRLHGKGRGISAWMAARSVVPTDLPAPFPQVLPPLSSGMSWEVATGGLDDPELCAALAEIEDEDFRSLVSSRCFVSAKTDELLALLWARSDGLGPAKVGLWDLLTELAERWDYHLTPTRLQALRPLSQAAAWELVPNDPHGTRWCHRFRARSAAGSFQPLQKLLLPDAPALRDQADQGRDDELLRSGFAPNTRILDPAYIESPDDVNLFRWLRVRHSLDAAEIADWYSDAEEDLRPAALRYLLDGELRNSVLPRLIPVNARPPWLRNFNDIRQMLERICNEPWRRQLLLFALFPDQFRVPEWAPAPVVSGTFFSRLSEWWDDAAVRSEVTDAYESRTWPEWLRRDGGISDGLQAGSEDHWLALLVLGACRSIGRTQDNQHRTFLEWVNDHGWWNLFMAPDDAGAWMRMLREWQDSASSDLPYAQWMSLFPAIYQLSRYRERYTRLLRSAGQRRESEYDITRLFAPGVDPALTFAGTHFIAPPAPLNMGRHWVLRELVRLNVVDGAHMYPDCWMPSEQVLGFLHRFGLRRPDDGMTNPQKARAISDFMASELGTATPNLHRAFDIPIRHVASDPELGRRFGLEQ